MKEETTIVIQQKHFQYILIIGTIFDIIKKVMREPLAARLRPNNLNEVIEFYNDKGM